ncbi:LVIVD repeat-containing protein [Halovivax limisalsi]|uniref:LVIVD repeat-containing protein n=1 Tax=Halovivax limisalsi TaxID=1453760 RepID=UPI001FFDD45E|nr:hypothetical protein [Halovivax limisalsi]
MASDDERPNRRRVLRSMGALGALGVASGGANLAGANGREATRFASETNVAGIDTESADPIARLDIGGGIAEGVVSDDLRTAYVAIDQGFVSVDITDPQNPTELARRTDTGMSEVLDVKTAGDRVIAVGPGNFGNPRGMGYYDVTDPANPQLIEWYETSYTIHNAYLTEDIAYLINNGAAQIHLIDVSDDDPTEITTYDGGGSPLHDIYVQDDVLYMAYWDYGTHLVDVSNPSSPSPIAKVRDGSDRYPNNDHYVIPNEDGTIVAIGKEEMTGSPLGIELWDITDPTDTAFLAEIEPPSAGSQRTSHNLDIVGDYMYSSFYDGGVRVHDISDPANPDEIYNWRGDGASFWTAKVGVPGEFFIGTDYGNDYLYTFPDPGDHGGGGGDCGAESASGSADGFLAWWNTEEVTTYSTQTANPCGVTVELEGPGFANFDLYVTYDGRTPTRDDYDDRSAGSGASESVSGDLSGSTDVGILVDGADGWGEYSVAIGEDGVK